jgi:hypothetical protein
MSISSKQQHSRIRWIIMRFITSTNYEKTSKFSEDTITDSYATNWSLTETRPSFSIICFVSPFLQRTSWRWRFLNKSYEFLVCVNPILSSNRVFGAYFLF